MNPPEAAAILVAGVGAGTINAVVGSGTLITFPTLIAFGIPSVSANISNTIGLVPGSIAGAYGYRRELAGQRERLTRWAGGTATGALVGAMLLLVLPSKAFSAIVPVLIGIGVVLVVVGPRVSSWVEKRHEHVGGLAADGAGWVLPALAIVGVYGGYFGAAQGLLLMAVLGTGVGDSMQRLNGAKNVLATLGTAVASFVFLFVASHKIDWMVVLLLTCGSIAGGLIGASVGRRLGPSALRAVTSAVGVTALVMMLKP